MRVMGLDYGTKTVGVAISDPVRAWFRGQHQLSELRPRELRQYNGKRRTSCAVPVRGLKN